MKVNITVDIPDELGTHHNTLLTHVKNVINDAMIDFDYRRSQGDAEEYVDGRYPSWTGTAREKKIKGVKTRLKVAELIRSTIEVTPAR